MEDVKQLFLRKMIEDSLKLEEEGYYYSAFDKLARGLESIFNSLEGDTQGVKASALFSKCLSRPAIWNDIIRCSPNLLSDVKDFAKRRLQKDEGNYFVDKARRVTISVQRGNRQNTARDLANLVLHLRNQRFHGNESFGSIMNVHQRAFDMSNRLTNNGLEETVMEATGSVRHEFQYLRFIIRPMRAILSEATNT